MNTTTSAQTYRSCHQCGRLFAGASAAALTTHERVAHPAPGAAPVMSPAQKAAATRRAARAVPAIPADISSVFVAAPKARPEDLEALRLAAIGAHRYSRNPNRREAVCVCGKGQSFPSHIR